MTDVGPVLLIFTLYPFTFDDIHNKPRMTIDVNLTAPKCNHTIFKNRSGLQSLFSALNCCFHPLPYLFRHTNHYVGIFPNKRQDYLTNTCLLFMQSP